MHTATDTRMLVWDLPTRAVVAVALCAAVLAYWTGQAADPLGVQPVRDRIAAHHANDDHHHH